MIDPNQPAGNAAAGTSNQDPLRAAMLSMLGQPADKQPPSIQVNATGVSVLPNQQPLRDQPGDPDTDLVSHRYFVADALRRRGWNEDAIGRLLGRVSLTYNTDPDRRPDEPSGTFTYGPNTT